MVKHTNLNSGFIYEEARDLLGLSLSADLFAPMAQGVAWVSFKTTQITPENDPDNPISKQIEEFYPYPEKPIWPENWTPGIKQKDANGNVWTESIIASTIPGFEPGDPPLKANSALFAYNKKLDAYCIAFAGTTNLPTTMQDVLYTPVKAGPVEMLDGSSEYKYMSNTSYVRNWDEPIQSFTPTDDALFDQPPKVIAKVSMGIRFGLETLTINGDPKKNLLTMLASTGKKKINLFLTGHSLGAGMASLFAAWLQANDIPGVKINVKTYAFAPEKIGNETFVDEYNTGATNQGMHFIVRNTLDICPQLPLTIGKPQDLVNPKGTRTWLPYITQKLLAEYAKLLGVSEVGNDNDSINTNYFHPGWSITLPAEYPVIYDGEYYPQKFFPGSSVQIPIENENSDSFDISFLRIWWQHMPWNYRYYLDKYFKK